MRDCRDCDLGLGRQLAKPRQLVSDQTKVWEVWGRGSQLG